MGSPSDYPNFRRLAREVAQQAGMDEPGLDEPLENFFGKLKSQGVDVHSIVRQRLTNPQSRPNELHIGLLSLFKNSSDVRLVTTNFDNHFSTSAIDVLRNSPEIYRSPALPLGHRFKGIVYLHGSVEQEPEELILTDIDFGRAYLTEAWATRFLLGLFSNYVVLFVGYSHEDTILNYLARGLPPGTERYALVRSDDDGGVWENIGVSKIIYPRIDGGDEYRALPKAISEWAKRSRMDFLEHEERIMRIVESGPPLDQNEIDYIDDVLKETPTARLFANHAKSPEWLRWCENRGLLDDLFDPVKQPDALGTTLAWWFAANYVGNQSEEGLAVVQRKGTLLSSTLWRRVAWHLWTKHDEICPEMRTKWIIVLLSSASHVFDRQQFLEYILSVCKHPDDDRSALLLFQYLIRPEVILKKAINFSAYGEGGSRLVRFEASIIGDEYWLRNIWQGLFRPNIESFADNLEPMLTNRLQQIHLLLQATGEATEAWDPVSDRRSAIEAHGQNSVPDRVDFLIDAARDVIESLLVTSRERASSILDNWARSDVPIFRRLAIHGMAKSNNVSPDAKISWLLEKGWLFSARLKHEVFQLLKAAYPSSNDATKRTLLAEVMANLAESGAEEDGARHADYQVYNLLVWLSQAAPDCTILLEQLMQVQSMHPEFGPQEHPDLDSWSFSWEQPHSEEPDPDPRYRHFQVEDLLAKEPESIVDSLIAEQSVGTVCYNVAQAVATSFAWGWTLAAALKTRSALNTPLGESLISGWSRSRLSEGDWANVLSILNSEQGLLEHKEAIADFLFKGVDIPDGNLPYSLLSEGEALSEKVWDLLERHSAEDDDDVDYPSPVDWRYKASISPGGHVVNFWIYSLSKRRSEGKEEWLSLPENYRSFFARVLDGNSAAAERGRILLAVQFRFLHSNDADWSTLRLLPLFDWSLSERQAELAWNGFLHGANWDEAVCKKLLPLMTPLFPLLSSRLSGLCEMITDQLAGLFVHYGSDLLLEGRLNHFLVSVQEKDRVRFASMVSYYLRSISDEAKRARWEAWIGGYWRQRVQGIPRQLSAQELEKMILWAVELEPVFDSVVDVIRASPAPDLSDGFVYHRIKDIGLSRSHSQAVANLLEHLSGAATGGSLEHTRVPEILDDLMDANVSPNQLRQIAGALLRLEGYVSTRLREYIRSA